MLAGSSKEDTLNGRPEPPTESDPTTTPRVLSILSFVLQRLVARNDQLELSSHFPQENGGRGGGNGGGGGGGFQLGKSLEAFHGVRAPAISVPKYLERIYKYTNCSPSCFVVGYVYIDRLVHRYPDSLVVSLNVHRLLVTCVMLAAKVLDDVHYNNAFYARVGGVSNSEINKLELYLLFMLDFDLTVTSRVFESYCLHLEKEMIMYNGAASQKIERPIITTAIDDVTEISVEDMQSSSPSPNGY